MERRSVGALAVGCAILLSLLFPAAGAAAAPKVTLNVYEWTNPPAQQATQVIDARFERAHPGVTVNLETAPTLNGAWATMWTTALAAKSVDVLAQFALAGHVPQPYEPGLQPSPTLANVEAGKYVNFAAQPWLKADFLPGVQQSMMGYKKGIYGVTLASYARAGIFYNKAMFRKAGITAPPTTFNALLADCAKLKKAGFIPIAVGGVPYMEQVLEAFYQESFPTPASALAVVKGLWTGRAGWTAPVWKKMLTRYEQLVPYFEPAYSGERDSTMVGLFATGTRYAMMVTGTYDGPSIATANPKLNFGWFPLPMTNHAAHTRALLSGDFSWVVPTSSPHRALAVAYVKFFSQPANYQTWESLVGAVPTEPHVHFAHAYESDQLHYLKTALTEFWLPSPPNLSATSLAFLPNDPQFLAPLGRDSVSQLQAAAQAQWVTAIHSSGPVPKR